MRSRTFMNKRVKILRDLVAVTYLTLLPNRVMNLITFWHKALCRLGIHNWIQHKPVIKIEIEDRIWSAAEGFNRYHLDDNYRLCTRCFRKERWQMFHGGFAFGSWKPVVKKEK